MHCSDHDCVATKNESFWDFKGRLDSVDNWPLMGSPFPMLAITGLYLLYVLKIGPAHMKNRQPFNLKNIIVLYNVIQVIASAYMVYLACKLSWPHGWISKTCLLEQEETKEQLTTIMYYYFLAKVSEVLDTIFFVLRKKYSQVTFLHVYHHAVLIINSWGILKYEPTYPTLFLRNINSFVHVIMYAYYAMSSFPSLTKYLWWKKYITSLQLVQFSLIFIHFALTYAISECTPSYPLCLTIFFNSSFFFYLFGQFYLQTYKKKDSGTKKIDEEKENKRSKKTDGNVRENSKTENDNNVIHRKVMMNGN
ncbi:very long chain fatty acid elongase 7-like [Anticarsia gemmatalis]|uniref:very long chain fatty acid elongase 7-like n=1 Tax=Anticarsia gemmatalis TaxID=129554 RepID=UPI003F757268